VGDIPAELAPLPATGYPFSDSVTILILTQEGKATAHSAGGIFYFWSYWRRGRVFVVKIMQPQFFEVKFGGGIGGGKGS
jgi:hypothetical protein